MMPTISAITVTFNAAKQLLGLIASLRALNKLPRLKPFSAGFPAVPRHAKRTRTT
jgi:hypothetical protein